MRKLVRELEEMCGQQVSVMGWVERIREMKNVIFLVLRDRSGRVQCVLSPEQYREADISLETVVSIKGQVVSAQNKYARVELTVKDLEVINQAAELPVTINQSKLELNIDTMLNHRVLCLRNERERAVFRIQAALCQGFADYLRLEDFTEIHSPKLVQEGAEGGANVFSLDYFGKRAYLAQSPQFYKQMMVIAGFERVYEIGPVFRAESHNSNRHLNEYVSMDLEIGFIQDEFELMTLETKLLKSMFVHLQEHCQKELETLEVKLPQIKGTIPHMKLIEAIDILRSEYGLPDMEGDLNPESERLISEYILRTTGSELLFLTDYPQRKRPMYTLPKENGSTYSFDLLFRGLEITTGGMRIHDINLLTENMRKKSLDPASYESYLEAFRYGAPPHGGLAIGLERLTAQLLGLSNVRRASLFPRDIDRLIP